MKWLPPLLLLSILALAPASLTGQAAQASDAALHNEDVIKMVKAGLNIDLVRQKIESATSAFVMTTDAMIELKAEGVPEEIIALMLSRQMEHQRTIRSRIHLHIQNLAMGRPEQRRTAYVYLEEQGVNALPMLREGLTSPRPEIRAACAEAVGRMRDSQAAALLRELLRDESREVRFAAAKSLADLRDAAALSIAQKTVAGGAEPLDGHLRLLGHRKDPDFLGFITMRLLREPNELTRKQAAWALGEIGSPRACEALEDALLMDPDIKVKRAAAEALGKIAAPRSFRKLVEACKKLPDIRVDALSAIGHYPAAQSAEFLIVALGQQLSPEEHAAVLRALRRLTSRDFGDDLQRWNEWLEENRAFLQESAPEGMEDGRPVPEEPGSAPEDAEP